MSKNLPLISIGIPTYKRPDTLIYSLKSLANQSYKEIEIIISDNDCDKNNTDVEEIVNQFKTRLDITYYKQKENIGAANNFRFVLEKAKGKYFMWASDDDIWSSDFVELGTCFLEQYNRYNAWFCSVENIDRYGNVIREVKSLSRFSSSKNKFLDICYYLLDPEVLGKANLVYAIYRRKSLLEVTKKYFLNDSWGSDCCFNLSFLEDNDLYCDDRVLLQKRHAEHDKNLDKPTPIIIENPYEHIFPVCFYRNYLNENIRASGKIKTKLLVRFILTIRLLMVPFTDSKYKGFRGIKRYLHELF